MPELELLRLVIPSTIRGEPQGWTLKDIVQHMGKGKTRANKALTDAAETYQKRIILQAQWAWRGPPWARPFRLDVVAYMQRPQTLLRKSSPQGLLWCPGKPDLTNIYKLAEDALKKAGVVKDDDRRCAGESWRFYPPIGEPSRLELVLTALPEFPQLPGVFNV